MLTALALMLISLDLPDYAGCEAIAWQGDNTGDGITIEDHPLGEFDGHAVRVRACLEDAGFGYSAVFFVVWVQQDGGTWQSSYWEHGMTACPDVEVRRTRTGVRLRTPQCSYFDDDPTATVETRLRWRDDPPGFSAR